MDSVNIPKSPVWIEIEELSIELAGERDASCRTNLEFKLANLRDGLPRQERIRVDEYLRTSPRLQLALQPASWEAQAAMRADEQAHRKNLVIIALVVVFVLIVLLEESWRNHERAAVREAREEALYGR